jgi:hypothetical protein
VEGRHLAAAGQEERLTPNYSGSFIEFPDEFVEQFGAPFIDKRGHVAP